MLGGPLTETQPRIIFFSKPDVRGPSVFCFRESHQLRWGACGGLRPPPHFIGFLASPPTSIHGFHGLVGGVGPHLSSWVSRLERFFFCCHEGSRQPQSAPCRCLIPQWLPGLRCLENGDIMRGVCGRAAVPSLYMKASCTSSIRSVSMSTTTSWSFPSLKKSCVLKTVTSPVARS